MNQIDNCSNFWDAHYHILFDLITKISRIKNPRIIILGSEQEMIPLLKLAFPNSTILSFVDVYGFDCYEKIDSFREADFILSIFYDGILDLDLINYNASYAHIHIKQPADVAYSILRDFYNWSTMSKDRDGNVLIIKYKQEIEDGYFRKTS